MQIFVVDRCLSVQIYNLFFDVYAHGINRMVMDGRLQYLVIGYVVIGGRSSSGKMNRIGLDRIGGRYGNGGINSCRTNSKLLKKNNKYEEK